MSYTFKFFLSFILLFSVVYVYSAEGSVVNASGRNSNFWFTLKANAGTSTADSNDLVLTNGYRKVNLNSPQLSCKRTSEGNALRYTIHWTGNNFHVGTKGEDFSFSVLVKAYQGSDYHYGETKGSSYVNSVGKEIELTNLKKNWGNMVAGRTVYMKVEDFLVNAKALNAQQLLVKTDFNRVNLSPLKAGKEHKAILGLGQKLKSVLFHQRALPVSSSGNELYVTSGGSQASNRSWSVKEITIGINVRNPALKHEDAAHPFSDLKKGHTITKTPYAPTTEKKKTLAYPKFSWKRVPRTMLVRKSTAYTDQEIERMAKTYDIIVLEKANAAGKKNTFLGMRSTAQRLKKVNPDVKVVSYWNSRIFFGHYGIDDKFKREQYIDKSFTIRDGLPTYDRNNPALVQWWVNACFKMMGLVKGVSPDGLPYQPSAIDGVFIDKTGLPMHMLKPLYEGSGDNKFVMNNNGDNARARIAYLDGTYREGWSGGNNDDAIAWSIALAKESGKNQKLTMLRNFIKGVTNAREMEDRVDYNLAIYLMYAEKYAYFFHQSSVDAKKAGTYAWLTDYYDQFHRPLGKPLQDATVDHKVYVRGFEHCDAFLDLNPSSGVSHLARILWKNDIGHPSKKGSGVSHTDGGYTLSGSGKGFAAQDQCFYLSDLHYGDGELVTRLSSLANTSKNAKAGIMFRERTEHKGNDNMIEAYAQGKVLEDNAKMIAIMQAPSGEIALYHRASKSATVKKVRSIKAKLGDYVKLVRVKDRFTAYHSEDKAVWKEIASVEMTMAEKVEMGMAVCSGVENKLAKAEFAYFSREEK